MKRDRPGDGRGRRKKAAARTRPLTVPAATLDRGILGSAVVLLMLGLVMVYSTTAALTLNRAIPPLFVAHAFALVVGAAAAAVTARLPLSLWRRSAVVFWAFCMGLLIATALFGVEVNGAQRWLGIPGTDYRFQPGELAKCATLLAVASVISVRDGRQELSNRRAGVALLLLLPPVVLLVEQPDFGSAVLLCALVALLMVVAGVPLLQLLLPGTVAVSAAAAYVFYNSYALRRLTGFVDPWSESQGAGFQLVQSFVAFGQGGLWGAGLGNGRQKLFYLPEAHTDFILAVVAEELGLLGVLAVLGAFTALLIYGTRIARQAHDRFALLVAFGMTGMLTFPAAVNAAVVMGLLPTKGLTLPFLSYGRTSLIVCCVALGLLLGVSRSNGARPGARVSRATRRLA